MQIFCVSRLLKNTKFFYMFFFSKTVFSIVALLSGVFQSHYLPNQHHTIQYKFFANRIFYICSCQSAPQLGHMSRVRRDKWPRSRDERPPKHRPRNRHPTNHLPIYPSHSINLKPFCPELKFRECRFTFKTWKGLTVNWGLISENRIGKRQFEFFQCLLFCEKLKYSWIPFMSKD